jgi:hypothetical protein
VAAHDHDDQDIVCLRCGTGQPGPDDGRRLEWVLERQDGGVRWLCPDCAREHLRDIEGKLPHEYW